MPKVRSGSENHKAQKSSDCRKKKAMPRGAQDCENRTPSTTFCSAPQLPHETFNTETKVRVKPRVRVQETTKPRDPMTLQL